MQEQKRGEKRKSILKKLNEFYGPLISYLNITKALFKIFSADKPKEFRTLTYLLDPYQEYETERGKNQVQLTETDHKLLKEIIEIEKSIEDLIVTKSGLIDDDTLIFDYIPDKKRTDVDLSDLSLLSIAVTHFRVLKLAYEGNFRGEVDRFKNFVYPRELNDNLKKKINALQADLEELTK